MNAPKKIFVPYAYAHAWAMTTKVDSDVEYVRAYLVDGLVEALEGLVWDVQQSSTGDITAEGRWEALDKARASLAKLKKLEE